MVDAMTRTDLYKMKLEHIVVSKVSAKNKQTEKLYNDGGMLKEHMSQMKGPQNLE